jgi:putative endonuclease
MYYVYFLFLNNEGIYKGITSDLKRRINEHKLGKVTSTKYKRPIKLIHYEAYLLKEDAERREKYLKTTYGRRDIKRQLSSLLKELKIKQMSSPDD